MLKQKEKETSLSPRVFLKNFRFTGKKVTLALLRYNEKQQEII